MNREDYSKLVMAHYAKVAAEDGDSILSTMKDAYIRQKETEAIVGAINYVVQKIGRELNVADVGCGNGTTLSVLSEMLPQNDYVGIEKNDGLRNIAEDRFRYAKRVNIYQGDILENMIQQYGRYDIVISQRVIINILNREDQRQAIANVSDLVKPEGYLILIECMEQSWANLNSARNEFDLPPIEPSFHNLYLKEELLPQDDDGFSRCNDEGIASENFLSSHYYVTRVLHDVMLQGRPYSRNSHFVSFMSQAVPEGIGDYSPIKMYMFQKKAKK